MKLPFLYSDVLKSNIDNKKEMLVALTTHDWTITDIHRYPENSLSVDLESDKGYWLSNVPLYLFSNESLANHIVELNKKNK